MLRRVATVLIVSASATAVANPAMNVPSAADPGNSVDLHVTVDYEYEADRSHVEREVVGGATDPTQPLPVEKDLTFHQFRHLIVPRAELGIYHDTWLAFALPVVIAQARELQLDGIDRTSSTTVNDGLLSVDGFDAEDPGTPTAGDLLFRGHGRHGLSQVHLGLGVAPMNQLRDPTKPTWKLGAELRLAVGKIMRFDAMNPAAETGVSKGVHELRLWTSFARRFEHVESYFELFWQVPLTERKGSLFSDPGFGATNIPLGQTAGAAFGVELFALDDKVNKNRISLELGTRIVGHFEGRDYSEMWEVFALAGDSRGAGPLVLDADPTQPDVQPLSHPGISNFENYLETAARFAIRAQLGSFVQFAALVDLNWKTDHVISFADAGIDLPTCAPGVGKCETNDNDLVNPGTEEVNPLHAPRIDLVGHRYHSVDNLGVVVGVQGIVLF